MNTIVVTYVSYLCLSVALTVWVAQTLHKNGRIFLVDVFHGNEALADSVNHLLVVGFYLINFGYVTLALKIGYEVESARARIHAATFALVSPRPPEVVSRRVTGGSAVAACSFSQRLNLTCSATSSGVVFLHFGRARRREANSPSSQTSPR